MTNAPGTSEANLSPTTTTPIAASTLGEIRAAVLLHMYEEEGTWFPLIKERVSEMHQQMLTERFLKEYRRYTYAPE